MSNNDEWTTVVHHKSRTSKNNHAYKNKNLSIMERVQQGSLDPEDAVKMIQSHSNTDSTGQYNFYKKNYTSKPSFAVTRGGSVALYGFHKRPLVLYANRWTELKEYLNNGELEKFLDTHKSEFKKPSDKPSDKPWFTDSTTPSATAAATPSATATAVTAATATTSTATVAEKEDEHVGKPYLSGD